MNDTVLFLIGGFGLGNSTRCEPVVEHFAASGMRVEVATFNNGLKYYEQNKEISALHRLKPLTYSNWSAVYNYFSNVLVVARLLRANNYKLIFIDSDYTLLFLRFFLRVPIIAINNSHQCFYKKNLKRLSLVYFKSFLVEATDYLFHLTVPWITFVPSLDSSRHWKGKKFFAIPPLSRAFPPVDVKTPSDVLALFSGSGIYDARATMSRLHMLEDEGVKVVVGEKLSQVDLRSYLASTKVVVSNGGFSTISECFNLTKPLVVLPIPGHFEQMCNSANVRDLQLGLIADEINVATITKKVLDGDFAFDPKFSSRRISSSDVVREICTRALALRPKLPLTVRLFLFIRRTMTPYQKIADQVLPYGKILDLGCGHGALAASLAARSPHLKVEAYDHDPARVRVAKALGRDLPNLTIQVGDLLNTLKNAQSNAWDCICLIDCIHYFAFDRHQEIISEAFRCLKDNGTLLIREPSGAITVAGLITRLYEFIATAFGLSHTKQRRVFFRADDDWSTMIERQNFFVTSLACARWPLADVLYVCQKSANEDQHSLSLGSKIN